NFDGTADMGLSTTAVSPGSTWTTSQDATSTSSLAAESSGDASQGRAAHFRGQVGPNANLAYAEMDGNLSGIATDARPTGVDASAYAGIAFKVKAGPGNTATSVLVIAANEESIPACGLCNNAVVGKECYAGYRYSAAIFGSSWTTVMIPFG